MTTSQSADPTLVLASGSPRRRDLIGRLGLPVEVVASGVDEVVPPGLSPAEAVVAIAERKARSVMAGREGGLVVGADTNVVIEDEVLGKPDDAADAVRMLRLLRGRVHRVYTGVVVLDAESGRIARGVVRSDVRMRAYDEAEIAAYVAGGDPLDKAGGYGLQSGGNALVAGVEGCFNNVVGLPLCEVAALLGRFGVRPVVDRPVCTLPDGQACQRLVR